ncbi:MAG: manganese transporter [Planctomycetaceae bacterium]|nr:MAG: manganese transporter [Planctomycetaceae bacterium]
MNAPIVSRSGRNPSRPWSLFLLLCGTLLALSGCESAGSSPGSSPGGARASGSLRVLATTGMIADSARQIAGEDAEVTALMGPGVDPHLYQPTTRDQRRLREAQLVLYNGLHLEGKMVEVFESLSREKRVVAVSEEISPERLLAWADSVGMHDPHVWFDVGLWKTAVETMIAAFCEADPPHAADYRARGAAYLIELEKLDGYCRQRVEELAPERRVLITSHDAFHYLGRAYGFEVVGIQGISTESEAGLKRLTDTVDLIRARGIRAIFPESSVPRAAIERVAADARVLLGAELYSDALGPADGPAGTYIGMIRSNIDAIVTALSGELK